MASMGVDHWTCCHRVAACVFSARALAADGRAGCRFLIVVATPVLLTTMAWVGLANVRRDGRVPRWRFWISLCGCVALSLALAIPWIAFFLSMLFLHLDWLRL